MKKFKHSGTIGDLIYSLPIVKHFGGGEFYLHLNQIDWICQYYYGSTPAEFHRGRMNQQDLESMRSFMLAQTYITKFDQLTADIEITHNLDHFRPLFVNHPGNYIDIYASSFNLNCDLSQLRNQSWLTVPSNPNTVKADYVINRSARWISQDSLDSWMAIKEQTMGNAVFVGLESEHRDFCQFTDWNIEWVQTRDLLELAQVIDNCDQFVGNQSAALSLAIGLGKEFYCEARRDLPLERNECYFPDHPRGEYF